MDRVRKKTISARTKKLYNMAINPEHGNFSNSSIKTMGTSDCASLRNKNKCSINQERCYPRKNQESPLPENANIEEINQLASLIGHEISEESFTTEVYPKSAPDNLNSDLNHMENLEDINKTLTPSSENAEYPVQYPKDKSIVNNIEEDHILDATLNPVSNNNSEVSPAKESSKTPHCSPDCGINHLDFDCDNMFCPYFIENAVSQGSLQQSFDSSCYSTPQANTPLSYISNDSTPRSRKQDQRKDKGNIRKRHENEWMDTKRKVLRNLGKSYTTRKGIIKPSKEIQPPCNCRLKCFEKICEDQRRLIFEHFWSLGDRHKQWSYVTKLVVKKIKRRVFTDTESRRKFTLEYSLPIKVEENLNHVKVCKKQFLATISVSEQFVYTALGKTDQSTGCLEPDQRGRHTNHPRKITEEVKKSVCDHIRCLQPVESHYTRKNSTKLYLDGDLNFHRLFQMYNEWFDPIVYQSKAQSERQYRDIVNETFKLSFYIPKKDQCDQCHTFKNLTNPLEKETADHEKHVNNKNVARELKCRDKSDANSSQGKIVAATFDFQKVLNAPHGQISVLYYKRKLSVFNFTIFDLAIKEGTCYMWHEGEAKRGANEVSSCLLDFIAKKFEDGAKEFRFWSDNCSGQNRNRIVFALYIYAAKTYKVNIRHTFLEKGHTQSEGDSVHALIERSSKNKTIYTPLEWFSLVRWAKQDGKPYKVVEKNHTDFLNFKSTLKGYNWTKNINRETVQWSKIKEVRVNSEDPCRILYRYDLSDNTYMTVATKANTRKRQRECLQTVEPLYSRRLPIPKAKYDDLLSLCDSRLIPETYHYFFKNLPTVVVDSQTESFSDSE